jgi:MbtH protein
MQNDFDYKILVNDEGQYSIWPEMKASPLGWKETGPAGSKEEVLEWVKANWTDMRPASLRATPEPSS